MTILSFLRDLICMQAKARSGAGLSVVRPCAGRCPRHSGISLIASHTGMSRANACSIVPDRRDAFLIDDGISEQRQ
jgi:hypothetical protein